MVVRPGDRAMRTMPIFAGRSAQTVDYDVERGDIIRRSGGPGSGDAASMRVILDVLDGPRKGQSFVFDRHDMFIVGRSRFVHCSMPEDSALSRDHFLIEINPPRCEVRDLGSTNGTYVN